MKCPPFKIPLSEVSILSTVGREEKKCWRIDLCMDVHVGASVKHVGILQL